LAKERKGKRGVFSRIRGEGEKKGPPRGLGRANRSAYDSQSMQESDSFRVGSLGNKVMEAPKKAVGGLKMYSTCISKTKSNSGKKREGGKKRTTEKREEKRKKER